MSNILIIFTYLLINIVVIFGSAFFGGIGLSIGFDLWRKIKAWYNKHKITNKEYLQEIEESFSTI